MWCLQETPSDGWLVLGYQHASAQQTHCRSQQNQAGVPGSAVVPVGVGREEGDPWLCGTGQLGVGASLHNLWWPTQWG